MNASPAPFIATSYAVLSPVPVPSRRSEEHTSELQSRFDLVCRLLRPPPTSPLFPYTTLFRSHRLVGTRSARLREPRAGAARPDSLDGEVGRVRELSVARRDERIARAVHRDVVRRALARPGAEPEIGRAHV